MLFNLGMLTIGRRLRLNPSGQTFSRTDRDPLDEYISSPYRLPSSFDAADVISVTVGLYYRLYDPSTGWGDWTIEAGTVGTNTQIQLLSYAPDVWDASTSVIDMALTVDGTDYAVEISTSSQLPDDATAGYNGETTDNGAAKALVGTHYPDGQRPRSYLVGDGTGYGTLTGLLTTDTISVGEGSGTPTCTVNGRLDIASGVKCWDLQIHRSGVLIAKLHMLNTAAGNGDYEYDASGNGNNLLLNNFTGSPIVESPDTTGTNSANEDGFSVADGFAFFTPVSTALFKIIPPGSFLSSCVSDILHATINSSAALSFNDVNIISYVSAQALSGTVSIEDDGATLHVEGNRWVMTEETYTITANTVIEFDLMSTVEPEILGIGFDEDAFGFNAKRVFQLFGKDTWSYAIQVDPQYASSDMGTYVHYIIPVGQYYTGSNMHLVIINDHDAAPANGNSWLKNFAIHEVTLSAIETQYQGLIAQDIQVAQRPAVEWDGTLYIAVTGITTSMTFDVHSGDTPTCTTNGQITGTTGEYAAKLDVYEGATLWASYDLAHDVEGGDATLVQDFSGNEHHGVITNPTGSPWTMVDFDPELDTNLASELGMSVDPDSYSGIWYGPKPDGSAPDHMPQSWGALKNSPYSFHPPTDWLDSDIEDPFYFSDLVETGWWGTAASEEYRLWFGQYGAGAFAEAQDTEVLETIGSAYSVEDV